MAQLPHHTFIYRVCIVHNRDIIGHKFMLILLTQTREMGHYIKCLARFGETINVVLCFKGLYMFVHSSFRRCFNELVYEWIYRVIYTLEFICTER